MKDLYEILEVNKNSTKAEIKSAYRKLAKKYHPDLNPNNKEAEEKFKEVNFAYEILSDDARKQKYDMYGEASFNGGASDGSSFSGFSDMEDIFEGIFGGFSGFGSGFSKNPNRPRKGQDIETYVELDFFEAVNGCKKDIEVEVKEKCKNCNRTGSKDGKKPQKCKKCNGTGTIKTQHRSFLGTVISEEICSECSGKGEIILEKCENCKGKKYVITKKKISINVPKGINTNNVMTLKAQGNCGENQGANGDIYVVFKVKKHDLFVREGNNVSFELPISFTEATLGAVVEIPTLEGKETYTIPEGTQTSTVFTLANRGISDVNGYGKGDLSFKVKIITPKNLTDKQKELLREFSNEREENLKAHKKNFFEKVKELFE